MACSGCRSRTAYQPSRNRVTVVTADRNSPCAMISAAGDEIVVELVGSSLVMKTPYSASGLGMQITLRTLSCQGVAFDNLRQLELSVGEVLMDPRRAAKFRAKLPRGLMNLAVVRAALASVGTL